MRRILLTIGITFLITGIGKTQIHTITISPNQRVASIQMSPSEYSSWITNDEFNNYAKREALVQEIYQKFDDKFDFIFFILNETSRPANLPYAGELIGISNVVTGIGLPIYNNAAAYGSLGKLKSVMALTSKESLLYGPSLHELAHNWANFIIDTKGWNGSAEYDIGAHWGFTGGNTKGQLGGFQESTLQTNIGGNPDKYSVGSFYGIANGGNSVPYTDLELYLMGMIPLTEVANFDVFRGLSQVSTVGSNIEFTASTRVTYDNAKILSDAGGARNPTYVTSQKNFRLLVVILTPTSLTSTEWNTFDDQSEKFGRSSSDGMTIYNFWEATRGLGTLETGNLLNAVKATVGLVDIQSTEISVFPNPVSGVLSIDYKNENYETINIYNSQGVLLRKERAILPMQRFDFSAYKNGLYILECINPSGEIKKIKVIKY